MKFLHIYWVGALIFGGAVYSAPLVTSEVPPPAPQLELPAEVRQEIKNNPSLKIAPYIRQSDPRISTRFSTDSTGTEIVSRSVPQTKQICFYVNKTVQGQIGTVISSVSVNSGNSLQRDVETSCEQAKRIFVNVLLNPETDSLKATSGSSTKVSLLQQLPVSRNPCVEIPFKGGQVAVYWLSVGEPNTEAANSQIQKGPDGVLHYKVLKNVPAYIIGDPNLAEVIHSAVVDLSQPNPVIFNDPEL